MMLSVVISSFHFVPFDLLEEIGPFIVVTTESRQ